MKYTAPVGIAAITDAIQGVFTFFIGMISDVIDVIMAQPLLLFFIAIPFIPKAIQLFKNLKGAS